MTASVPALNEAAGEEPSVVVAVEVVIASLSGFVNAPNGEFPPPIEGLFTFHAIKFHSRTSTSGRETIIRLINLGLQLEPSQPSANRRLRAQ